MRKRVYFNEYNPYIGNSAYLPLVAGKLVTYAQTSPVVRDNYDFCPPFFRIEPYSNILNAYEEPDVACFSAAIWNEQLCLHVAAAVKARWPNCLVIFGGTQVPHDACDYMGLHSFIDVAVRAEGEEPFLELMERYVDSRDFTGIEKVTFRRPDGSIVTNPDSGKFERDLDVYPSPYDEGFYDGIVAANPDIRFQAIIETNRGCPFHCTFCYWGKGGLSRKYRYFGVDRVAAEMEWIGRNKVAFVYNADSNFGMHRRDEEIADIIVDVKERHGYPEKVVNLYGKNTDERIYKIARKLFDAGMHKGVGLSRQSMTDVVLKNIKRANISLDVYQSLQKKFEAYSIPVFCELIIGLPGETYDTFSAGIDTLLETSLHGQLIIVLCELYPNTEMADPEYQRLHGIVFRRNINQGVHSRVLDETWVPEYIDYVIGTNSMPVAEWKRTGMMSWTTMTLTGLRLGCYLMQYLRQQYGTRHIDFIRFISESRMSAATGSIWRREVQAFDAFMEQILAGKGRGILDPDYGEICWAVEEMAFLRIARDLDAFYDEMVGVTAEFLQSQGKGFDIEELEDVLRYQRLRIPTAELTVPDEHFFQFNVAEYFANAGEGALAETGVSLHRSPQIVTLKQVDFGGDAERFAREKLLWARRGGLFEVACDWRNVDMIAYA
jgi:radical SAM superfamily enzyme YgiQ (UPF0313 family)